MRGSVRPRPVVQIVGLVGPAGDHHLQAVGAGFHLEAVHRGDEHGVPPQQIIGLDIERQALDGIEFLFGRVDRRIVVRVDVAREIGALPLVLLAGHET